MTQIDHRLLDDADMLPLDGKSEGDKKKTLQSEILYHRGATRQ